jgi:soluble lytic murein transglycosylase-like protein
MQAAFAKIDARMQEISSTTGIPFGSFLSDSLSAQAAAKTGGSTDAADSASSASYSGSGLDGLALSTLLTDGSASSGEDGGLLGLSGLGGLGSLTGTNSLLQNYQQDQMNKKILDAINALKEEKTAASAAASAEAPIAAIIPETPAVTSTGAIPGNGAEYDLMLETAGAQYGVSPLLLKAVAYAESGFNPSAQSGSGAMGLMQLMPATARTYGVTDPFDPEQNIRGGALCLADHLFAFGGDAKLALAAYNCGASGVTGRGITDLNDPAQLSRLPEETQAYLRNVEAYITQQGGNLNAL